jgi:hypothetical protein
MIIRPCFNHITRGVVNRFLHRQLSGLYTTRFRNGTSLASYARNPEPLDQAGRLSGIKCGKSRHTAQRIKLSDALRKCETTRDRSAKPNALRRGRCSDLLADIISTLFSKAFHQRRWKRMGHEPYTRRSTHI